MRELSVSAASEPLEELDLVHAAAQVSAWCGEPLLYEGDDPAMTLAPGTARRRALDAALEEIAAGLKEPSTNWRFRFSLMLGLERVLASDPPTLANGLTLRPHQVDALAGMLAALTSSEEREAEADDEELNGDEAPGEELDAEEELEAGEDDELEALEDDDEVADRDDDPDDDAGDDVQAVAEGEEGEDDEEAEAVAEPEIHDPGAIRRYRFKHPTASGKTVAAAGFVEACRTVGVLILTHRRLLVDQFMRDLKEQGYGPRLLGGSPRSPSRRTPGSSSTRPTSTRTPTAWSSATRPIPHSASARPRRSAVSAARSTSA